MKEIQLGVEYIFQQTINCYHNNGSLRGALPSGTRIIFRNWSPNFENIMFSLASQPESIWGGITSDNRIYVRKVPVKKIPKDIAATLTGQKAYDNYKISKSMISAVTYGKWEKEFQKLADSKKPILFMPQVTHFTNVKVKITVAEDEDTEFNRLSIIE